jgi:AraC-like DNA-binding protein
MIDERGMFMGKLAITGGPKLRTKPFPQWPVYGKEEADGLLRVLESQKWGTLGPEVAKFTERFCNYLGVKHGVAVTNGTATMEVLLRAKGIGFGDEVLVPPYTFVATVSAVICVGATPVFVDIEEDTFNMDPDKLEQAITPRTKAVIPVHVGGRPCDMDKIMAIANKYNLFVIEDTAHAHGSEWKGQKCGSLGTAGSFSFQASKNLTAGEGGFISTNDTDLFEMCWSIHHCGRDYKGTVWYGHPYIGTNARMTEWQAVILNANELHRGESIDNEVVYYCIDMSTELLKGNVIDICEIKYIEPIVRNLYRFENKIQNDREVVNCIENIITEFESGKPGYELAVKGSTYHLLTALLRRHIENILTPEECNHRQKMFDKLKNALIYIENRYTDKLTLEVLAEQCGFSVYHFCHEFKKAIGKSPGEYITLYRIAKAEELLLNSDMSITDIALSTGFNDANYFSRAFRKYKEDSPSAYRKKNLLDR